MNSLFILRKNYKKKLNIKILKVKDIQKIIFLEKKIILNNTFLGFLNFNIYGFNKNYLLKNICIRFGISLYCVIYKLFKNIINNLEIILKSLLINNELIVSINQNIKLKRNLYLYNIKRQLLRLPSRGQRSKTNAQTAKKRNSIYIK